MARDVISYVSLDTKPKESDSLDVLIIDTTGARPVKLYRDLTVIKGDFPDVGGEPSKIYRKAAQLFNQGKTTMAESLYRKVKIVGFAAPEDPAGLIDAIESFRQNDDAWSVFLTDQDEREYQEALIAYAAATEPTFAELEVGIEDHRKLYFGQTMDKDFTFDCPRGSVIYVNDLEEEGDAAYLGNVGPFYPVRKTWKFKRPDGVGVADLTEGEKDALDEQHVNYMTSEYGRVYVKNGVCTDSEFIDTQLGADFIAKRVRDKAYDVLLQTDDVPYMDEGFSLLGAAVIDALNDATDNRIIARDPESGKGVFFVVIPTRAQATDDQARNRLMPDIFWEALIEGAVHRTRVRGVLRASLVQDNAA